MQLEGILTPVITPFAGDLSIDYDAFGAVLDWQLENGVHSIIVGGSTGEFFSLSQSERGDQLRFAAQRIAGRVPLIAGVNDLLAEQSYKLASVARDAGADALLVAAPPYSLPDQDELATHCLKIARTAELPAILYNYPGRTGVNMERAFLDQVADSKSVIAIKESSGDLDRIHMLASDYSQLQLSAGAEDQVLEFFAWGARSWVSVIANFMPEEAVRLYETCVLKGDFVTGRKMVGVLMPLMYYLERGGKFLQSVKFCCEVMGRPGGPVRPPMLPLPDDFKQELRQIVQTAQAELKET